MFIKRNDFILCRNCVVFMIGCDKTTNVNNQSISHGIVSSKNSPDCNFGIILVYEVSSK